MKTEPKKGTGGGPVFRSRPVRLAATGERLPVPVARRSRCPASEARHFADTPPPAVPEAQGPDAPPAPSRPSPRWRSTVNDRGDDHAVPGGVGRRCRFKDMSPTRAGRNKPPTVRGWRDAAHADVTPGSSPLPGIPGELGQGLGLMSVCRGDTEGRGRPCFAAPMPSASPDPLQAAFPVSCASVASSAPGLVPGRHGAAIPHRSGGDRHARSGKSLPHPAGHGSAARGLSGQADSIGAQEAAGCFPRFLWQRRWTSRAEAGSGRHARQVSRHWHRHEKGPNHQGR